MSGKLYIVGTPIGNLDDFSVRGVKTLQTVTFIAAEDTRVTRKLCNHFDISTPLVSYHEHNERERKEEILSRILQGEDCALVSDAGMPCISDPGEGLVALCVERGVEVLAVPGPCAAVTALAVSGLATSRFRFEGFLSTTRKNRLERLAALKNETATIIFYEAPHKLLTTLQDLRQAFGNRRISLIKELTKIHENVNRTTLEKAVRWYAQNPPKGEFVLVMEGAQEIQEEMTLQQAVEMARDFMESGLRGTEAAKQAAALSGFRKAEIYKCLLKE